MYQELDVVDGLTIAENIFLGHELARGGFTKRSRGGPADHASCCAASDTRTSPRTREVGQLSAANKQIVSMARALSHDIKLIIMDEPSAVLDTEEVKNLFHVVKELTSEGIAVVYITHRLEEIRQIGDRITVLKDGRSMATGLPVADTPTAELIRLMTGREVANVFPPAVPVPADAPVVLEVEGLGLAGVFADVSLHGARGRDRRSRRAWSAPAAPRSSRPSTARARPRPARSRSAARRCGRGSVVARRRRRHRASRPRSARARAWCSMSRST